MPMRCSILLYGALAIVVFTANAQAQTLKLGEKYEGELTGKKTQLSQILTVRRGPDRGGDRSFGNLLYHVGFAKEIKVNLKAKQELDVTCSVVGEGRKVALILLDHTGSNVANSKLEANAASLSVPQISATGTFTIVVFSDLAGVFTLKATGGSDTAVAGGGEMSAKEIEERIKQLERELADLREQLKKKKGDK